MVGASAAAAAAERETRWVGREGRGVLFCFFAGGGAIVIVVVVVVVLGLEFLVFLWFYLRYRGLFTYVLFVYIFSDAWNAFGLFTGVLRARRDSFGRGGGLLRE
jgi:hypothetical protein